MILLLLSIKQNCKAPGYSCAYQGGNGQVCYNYAKQPVFITILKTDLPFCYGFGHKCY